MPFSKENITFTTAVIGCVVIAVSAFVAFGVLATALESQVLAAAGAVGVLAGGLSAPIIGLYKHVTSLSEAVTKGQKAAKESRDTIHTKLNTIEQTAQAGTADKVVDEVQKTIAQQLLADHDFVEPLAKKVAEIIKPEISGIADDAARKALKLYVDSQSAPGRVQT